jgi:hypothetical protein
MPYMGPILSAEFALVLSATINPGLVSVRAPPFGPYEARGRAQPSAWQASNVAGSYSSAYGLIGLPITDALFS